MMVKLIVQRRVRGGTFQSEDFEDCNSRIVKARRTPKRIILEDVHESHLRFHHDGKLASGLLPTSMYRYRIEVVEE